MLYAFLFLMGLIAGATTSFLLVVERRRALKKDRAKLEAQVQKVKETAQSLKGKQERIKAEEARLTQFMASQQEELDRQGSTLKERQDAFDRQCVSYRELQTENEILKRDLQNIDVNVRKLHLDSDIHRETQETLDARGKELGARYLKENIKGLGASLNPNNYAAAKQKLLDVIERCRGIGFEITPEAEAGYLADLKAEYERIVRAAFEREEQARIRAQIRDEQKREREIEQELKRLDRERAAIKAALEKALAEATDKHSEEVEQLQARLAEAEAKAQRTISQAQLTKSGHVYVISNIGSFGEGVFKIGMTRRLEPLLRVRELGDASVPFPFDVHMMISCDDAPSLENALHRELHKNRLNKTNPRKEFFRSDFDVIRRVVNEHHGEVQYVADPEALEYRQSLSMSDEDAQFIEAVYDAAEDEEKTATAED